MAAWRLAGSIRFIIDIRLPGRTGRPEAGDDERDAHPDAGADEDDDRGHRPNPWMGAS